MAGRRQYKNSNTVKKSSFVRGAFVATFGIVITKILGILYVIPFHAIIGEKGGALYGYAYTIYLFFMSLSSAGIPLAISKVVSEYQTKGYYSATKRTFFIGKRIAFILGLSCFIVLQVFASMLAKCILGNLTGGNTIEDVSFVIRIIATAVLIVPVLSIYRGYFEGHRFMGPPSFSQIVEQLARVVVIVLGSFLTLRVFNFSLTSAVGVAVFGATAGSIASYFYLLFKLNKNKNKFNEKVLKVNEPIITNKVIFKKIIIYAIPFVLIDIFKTLYNYVDMVTVVKGLVNYAQFSVSDAETVMGMLSTWGAKFNMIILAISTGIIVSLIPNLTKTVVEKNSEDINKKINQALSILLFLTVPMTIGISFLSSSLWTLFYGKSIYGPSVLSYCVFVGFVTGLFTTVVSIMQSFNDKKAVFISLISGLIVKILLNTKLISAFYKMGVPSYYGVITASIFAYLVALLVCLIILHTKYKVEYEETVKHFIDILCASMLMMLVLFLIKFVVPISSSVRIFNLFIVLFYAVVGEVVYFAFTYKTKTMQVIFGNSINKYIKKTK